MKNIKKIFIFTSAILIATYLLLRLYFGVINPQYQDVCLDVGYCKEGLTLNDEGETFIINKETCLKHNGKWLDDGFCNFR